MLRRAAGAALRRRRLAAAGGRQAARRQQQQQQGLALAAGGEDAAPLARAPQFYAAEALQRRYYMYIDREGRLFEESVQPKNIATANKDSRFLDLFWRRLARNEGGVGEGGVSEGDYPYVSDCQGEHMFVRAADTPVVFSELDYVAEGEGGGSDEEAGAVLRYAGSREERFDPASLVVSAEGRLYHPFSHRRLQKGLGGGEGSGVPPSPLRLGLLRSGLALRLAPSISTSDGGTFEFEFQGRRYPVRRA